MAHLEAQLDHKTGKNQSNLVEFYLNELQKEQKLLNVIELDVTST